MAKEEFYVDSRGNVLSTTGDAMHFNVCRLNDVRLLEGKYERSGFGMTERERRAAQSLREQGWLK